MVVHQGENIVRLEVATGNCAFQLDTFSPSLLEQLYFRGDKLYHLRQKPLKTQVIPVLVRYNRTTQVYATVQVPVKYLQRGQQLT